MKVTVPIFALFCFTLMACNEPNTPANDQKQPTKPERVKQEVVVFHPRAQMLFDKFTALEKEEVDYSRFPNQAKAQSFVAKLETAAKKIFTAVEQQLPDRNNYLQQMKSDSGFSMEADLSFPSLEQDPSIKHISATVGAYLNPDDELYADAVRHIVYRWSSEAKFDTLDALGEVKQYHQKQPAKWLHITKIDPNVASFRQIYPDGYHIEVKFGYAVN